MTDQRVKKRKTVTSSSGSVEAGRVATKKHVTSACRSCAAAKTKCDGQEPCQPCTRKGCECIYEKGKDGRHDRKRTLEQLYTQNEAYENLLAALRESDDQSAHELLDAIRTKNLSLEGLVRETNAIGQRGRELAKRAPRTRDSTMSISAIIDQPTIQIPAKPWTNVTNSDYEVSHLISVYFTWHHFAYPSLDRSIFLEAARSQDLSTQYCSPFLVNSMLAIACMYTDHPAAFADPKDSSTRRLHFQEEATRLWRLEEGKTSLTNLQGLPHLISCFVASGKDRSGLLYTNYCGHLSIEIVDMVKRDQKQGSPSFASDEFQRSYKLAVRAAFNLQTEVALAWMKPIELRLPLVKPPEVFQTTEQWQPYPRSGAEVVYHPQIIDNQRFQLYAIAAELLPVILSGNSQDSPLPGQLILERSVQLDRLHDVEQKLLDWHDNLPIGASIEHMDRTAPNAPLVDLHLAYHGFSLTLQSLARRRLNESGLDQDSVIERTIATSQQMANLLETMRRSVTFSYFSVYHMHASSLCAHNTLEFLSRAGVRDVFHTAIVGLAAAAQRWTLALGILKMLWITIQERELVSLIHASTLSLLKRSVADTWTNDDYLKFEACSYPNYAMVAENPRYSLGIGDLLSEYARLSLEEK